MLFKKTEKKPKQKETLSEAILGIAAVLVSGLFIITFIIQAFEIPSRSMEKTLLVGDHVFVDRLSAAPLAKYLCFGQHCLLPYRPLRRGEIAVFISPAQHDLHLVKRIVAVPGDKIHLENRTVFINGIPQKEPYVYHDPAKDSPDPFRDDFPEISPVSQGGPNTWPLEWKMNQDGQGNLVIPPGHYFAMGDNRENSYDSRYWGFVPEENLIGRPLFIYWSFDTPEEQYNKTAWSDRIGFVFHVIVHFFDQTRWSRMFHPVR
jgi:signal peptidase I